MKSDIYAKALNGKPHTKPETNRKVTQGAQVQSKALVSEDLKSHRLPWRWRGGGWTVERETSSSSTPSPPTWCTSWARRLHSSQRFPPQWQLKSNSPSFCSDFMFYMKRWFTPWIRRMMTWSTTWRQWGLPTKTNYKRSEKSEGFSLNIDNGTFNLKKYWWNGLFLCFSVLKILIRSPST